MPDSAQRADGAGALVSLRGVSKRQGLVQVLNGIDLDLAGGLVTVLLGPVGAGKSTLCRAVGGSDRIDSGSVVVAGEPLRRRRRRLTRTTDGDGRGGVGPVAEPGSLAAHRTVLQNVALGRPPGRAWLWRLGLADGELRAPALLERVGAARYAAHFPWELSDELRLRVAIARALAAVPALLLVDQPTLLPSLPSGSGSGFPTPPAPPLQPAPAPPPAAVPTAGSGPGADVPLLPALPVLLRDIAADGVAVLVTTDDPAFARAAADRVVFMEGGRIIEQGAPEDFFTTPRTARARAFLSTTAQH